MTGEKTIDSTMLMMLEPKAKSDLLSPLLIYRYISIAVIAMKNIISPIDSNENDMTASFLTFKGFYIYDLLLCIINYILPLYGYNFNRF